VGKLSLRDAEELAELQLVIGFESWPSDLRACELNDYKLLSIHNAQGHLLGGLMYEKMSTNVLVIRKNNIF